MHSHPSKPTWLMPEGPIVCPCCVLASFSATAGAAVTQPSRSPGAMNLAKLSILQHQEKQEEGRHAACQFHDT